MKLTAETQLSSVLLRDPGKAVTCPLSLAAFGMKYTREQYNYKERQDDQSIYIYKSMIVYYNI